MSTTATPDYDKIKERQQATWATGDYAVIGTTLQIVGEELCEAMDLPAGSSVLDVAAGNGNATLAAARRWHDVTSTDYVGELLERAKERAAAERLAVEFLEADVEDLPFDDDSFDAVISTFGVMFAPDQRTAAAEMIRVTRPGGRIGMANWTPEGFIGQLFKTVGAHVPPPAGVLPPPLWGTTERLEELFDGHAITATRKQFVFRYRSAEHWLEVFRTFYGPTNRAFAALDDKGQMALEYELLTLARRMNRAGASSHVVPSDYLEIIVTKM